MKRLLLSTIPFLIACCLNAQIQYPVAWLRADSATLNAPSWVDVSGNGWNAVPSTGALPDTFARMNFNKCFEVDGGQIFEICTHGIISQMADAIIVYNTHDSIIENGLWSIVLDSIAGTGLTTHRILGEHGSILYDTANRPRNVINYLFQSWETTPTDSQMLRIGVADSIFFEGNVSEFVIFDHHLSDTSLTQWLSYLAIKYGATLYKTNYLDSRKQCIWSYDLAPAKSYSIAGIGRDDVMGLNQKQTYFADDCLVWGLGALAPENESNTTFLSNGSFIVMGMDSNALTIPTSLYLANGDEHLVVANSLVQITGDEMSQLSTFLRFNCELCPDSTNPILIIDRSGTGEFHLEDLDFAYSNADSAGTFMFSDLHWDVDGNGRDAFCISVSADNKGLDMAGTRSSRVPDDESSDTQTTSKYLLTPNPASKHYRLEVDLAETSDIFVSITTADGKTVRAMTDAGYKHYVFDGYEDTPGVYLIEIISNLEHKTLKLIIQ